MAQSRHIKGHTLKKSSSNTSINSKDKEFIAVEGQRLNPNLRSSRLSLENPSFKKLKTNSNLSNTDAAKVSTMKTKSKDDLDKSLEEDTLDSIAKTRARRKIEEEERASQETEKPTVSPKKRILKPKAVVKKGALTVKKTLRGRAALVQKNKIKNVIRQNLKRTRQTASKLETPSSESLAARESVPIISPSEIKKEPIDDISLSNSRSSSPKTSGARRTRLSSDLAMMKSVLGETPSTFILSARSSPYSTRSDRSNSPTVPSDPKTLRSKKGRKLKNNLLNEIVKNEQNKRKRLLSDSKPGESPAESNDEMKKLKRGRSFSRDGSEISKCSDITESDISLCETQSIDAEKDLKKKDKKTDIDLVSMESTSSEEKVPSNSKTEKPNVSSSKCKKNKSIELSSAVDADNNNDKMAVKPENVAECGGQETQVKTETDSTSILDKMSKTFNSQKWHPPKSMKNRRRPVAKPRLRRPQRPSTDTSANESCVEDTLENMTKDIQDLIANLDASDLPEVDPTAANSDSLNFDEPNVSSPFPKSTEVTPKKYEEEEMTLRLEDDEAIEQQDSSKENVKLLQYRPNTADIDKLMDKLKHFEELDQIRQRERKKIELKTVMVTNDVVLIPKSGEIKPLKDIQATISPSQPVEQQNVLSCFENNSAISIVKKDTSRKSIEIDLPNSVTLIKRNSLPSRKESTSSNHSKDSRDPISMFEKSYGRDVTLTEIRKSVDKPQTVISNEVVLSPVPANSALIPGVSFDSQQVSITKQSDKAKHTNGETLRSMRKPKESYPRKNSSSVERDMAVLEKVKPAPSSTSITAELPKTSADTRTVAESSKSVENVMSPDKKISETIKSPEKTESPQTPGILKLQESIKNLDSKTENLTKTQLVTKSYIITSPKAVQLKSPENTKIIEFKAPEIQVSEIHTLSENPKFVENKIQSSVLDTINTPQKSVKSPERAAIPEIRTPVSMKSPETLMNAAEPAQAPVEINTASSNICVTNTAINDELHIRKIDDAIESPMEVDTHIHETTPNLENQIETPIIKPQLVEPKTVTPESAKESDAEAARTTEIAQAKIEPKEERRSVETKPEITAPQTRRSKEKSPEKGKDKAKLIEVKKIDAEKPKLDAEKLKPVEGIEKADTKTKPMTKAESRKLLGETPESQKRKESVLRTLGLLTHKAAEQAKLEKEKQKERRIANMNKNKNLKVQSGEYTGTLKTVIKLNRTTEKKNKRTSLKMTFQKAESEGENLNDDSYYTIHKEGGGSGGEGAGGRKTHYSNRLHHEAKVEGKEQVAAAGSGSKVTEPLKGKEVAPSLVIPEKASSFGIHPGRLCRDQCFYCGGKFGLFDTPCHIAQLKSADRQKKILDNEEKLSVDSCLCDACYRHVDRRARCPAYRRTSAFVTPHPTLTPHAAADAAMTQHAGVWCTEGMYAGVEDAMQGSEAEGGAGQGASAQGAATQGGAEGARVCLCHVEGCPAPAEQSIRRKWLIKMRPTISKVVRLELDYPGMHTIPLCGSHHGVLSPLLACSLCTRHFNKHHNIHSINQGWQELNPLLASAGIPVAFAERPVVCKLCRYYCTLLLKPAANRKHLAHYTRRLLQMYNIEAPDDPELSAPADDQLIPPDMDKHKKKLKNGKSKQRKSTESNSTSKTDESSSDKTESPEKSEKGDDEKAFDDDKHMQMDQDIESLISSNKIPVPGAKSHENQESDLSDLEHLMEVDGPNLPVDKQSELQYLLQRQNNPAQFLKPNANLTKHGKTIKTHSVSPMIKPGLQQKILDKNAKRIHKLSAILCSKEPKDEDANTSKNPPCEDNLDNMAGKKSADINQLKNKWQMSESFSQVKKNLSELSKNLTIEKTRKPDAKFSNPLKRLEANPSITYRELFPGEEEMNLQCNIEFNNVKGVTPEGWEKCASTIQYDVETKNLWHELQKPYGNQSSFLRHLVLLEKYFRSGDLVLGQNAHGHAQNYADSVQARLKAYDNIPTEKPPVSLIEFRKQKTNNKSLLKSNLNSEKNPKTESKNVFVKPKQPATPILPPSVVIEPRLNKNKPLPPELIAINNPSKGNKSIENVLKNIQQLVKGVSASDPIEVASSPVPATPAPAPKEVPKKQKTTTRAWRPTLMPITHENLARIAREPAQVAVDGRSLPSLVQVMSNGKRYHITLADYNKMCVMRREKLQQLHDAEPLNKEADPRPRKEVVTEIQTSSGSGGTITQTLADADDKRTSRSNSTEGKELSMADMAKMDSAATILKSVGLKNITIAPISSSKATSTVTSAQVTVTPSKAMSPGLPLTTTSASNAPWSTPIKIPHFPSVSITSETILTPNAVSVNPLSSSATIVPVYSSVASTSSAGLGAMVMPKIPKSLTVIPQSMPVVVTQPVPAVSQSIVAIPQFGPNQTQP